MYPYEIPKNSALELLGQIRELGNRVSPSGYFDNIVDGIITKHKLLHGLSQDEIAKKPEFVLETEALPKKLTIDDALLLI